MPAKLQSDPTSLLLHAAHLLLLHLHEQAVEGRVAGSRCVQARNIQAVWHLVLLLRLLRRRKAGVDGLPLGWRLALQRKAAAPVSAEGQGSSTGKQAGTPPHCPQG